MMDASRWKRVAEVFQQAVAVPPDERAAFLGRACGDDIELRVEVQKLLAHDSPATDHFLRATESAGDAFVRIRPTAERMPTIEGYEILRQIGRGGMGVVYEAIQVKLGRRVALKLLPAVVSSSHRDLVERFRREATAASKLHHSNIIPIYDFGESRDGYYYAMELLSGQPLSSVIRRLAGSADPISSPTQVAAVLEDNYETVPQDDDPHTRATSSSTGHSTRGRFYYRQAASWIADAAAGLHYAHLHGLIHRDVKPANIIICRDGRVVVVDFGLVKEAGGESVTATGSILGTYRYMSPEQVGAKRVQVDARTDVYSLGATLYELLVLQPAFTSTEQSELLGHILWNDPTPPRKIVSTVPVDLQTICLRAMEKSPARRYATAQDFAQDLRRFVENEPIKARPIGTLGRISRQVQRRPALSAVTGLAVILAAVAGAAIVSHQKTTRESTKRIAAEQEESKRQKVAALLSEANKRTAQNDFLGAAALFSEALEQDPDNLDGLLYWAMLEKDWFSKDGNTKHLEHTVQLADLVLQLDQKNKSAWNLKGIAARGLRRYAEALDAFQQVLEIDRASFVAWTNLGGVYAALGDLDKAEDAFRQAIQLEGGKGNTLPSRNLAAVLAVRGNADEAWTCMNSTLEVYSKHWTDPNASNLALHAQMMLEIPEHRNPRAALKTAIEANTSNSGAESVKRILAQAYLAQESETAANAEDARDAAVAAREASNPVEGHALMLLALAEARLGHRQDAESHLHEAKEAWHRECGDRNYVCRIEGRGTLWFVTDANFKSLCSQVEAALAAAGVAEDMLTGPGKEPTDQAAEASGP